MNISYDSYRIFYYVAKYGSISQAAKLLMNSQPNLTRMIKVLESELGCPLFSRTHQGVRLTPEGERLYAHISVAIEQIEGFCPKAAEVPGEAEADALAYLDFPYEHHVRLRTDNVQERASREPRRRSRVVQVFPGRKSPIGMMGAVLSEMDEAGPAAAGPTTTPSAGPSRAPR